jgi:hypothetical protein
MPITITPDPFAVAINLPGQPYSTSLPILANAAKYAGDWWIVKPPRLQTQAPGAPPVQYDADGYPLNMPDLSALGYALTTVLFLNGKWFPTGVYSLSFDGMGTVAVHQGDNTPVQKFMNQGTLAATQTLYGANRAGIMLSILESDPSDPVRNIRLLMPGETGATVTNAQFRADVKGFRVLRMMDAMHTNASPVVNYADFCSVTNRRYIGTNGLPLPVLIEIANETLIDPWFNIPDQLTEDASEQFAELVQSTLDPRLCPWVEFGNELWNFGGVMATAFNRIKAWGLARGLGTGQARATLAYQHFATWARVWGDAAGRLRRVLADQWSVPDGMKTQLDTIAKLDGGRLPGGPVDVLAFAPYLTPPASTTSLYTVATTPARINGDYLSLIPGRAATLAKWTALQQTYSQQFRKVLSLWCYEMGVQGINSSEASPWYGAYVAAGVDPSIAAVVNADLTQLALAGVQGGCWYHLGGPTDRYGPWGAERWLGDPGAKKLPTLKAFVAPAVVVPPVAAAPVALTIAGLPKGSTVNTVALP